MKKTEETKNNDYFAAGPDIRSTATVGKNTKLKYNTTVMDNAKVLGSAELSGTILISNNAEVSGNARLEAARGYNGCIHITHDAKVLENALIKGVASVSGKAVIKGNCVVLPRTYVKFQFVGYGDMILAGGIYKYMRDAWKPAKYEDFKEEFVEKDLWGSLHALPEVRLEKSMPAYHASKITNFFTTPIHKLIEKVTEYEKTEKCKGYLDMLNVYIYARKRWVKPYKTNQELDLESQLCTITKKIANLNRR